MINQGLITDPAEAKRILSESFANVKITGEKAFTNMGQRINELANKAYLGGTEGMLDPKAIGDGVYGAEREYLDWRRANPKATEREQNEQASYLQGYYLDQIKKNAKMGAAINTGYKGDAGLPPPPKTVPLPATGMLGTGTTKLTHPLTPAEQAELDALRQKRK